MVTKEDLEKRYHDLSNHELMEIIENKFSYTELAVSVAFEEISKRKISEEDIRIYKKTKVDQTEKFIRKNVVDDLTFIQKNLFFYLWIPFIGFLLKRKFIDDEYILKLKQANYYSWFGFISCFLSIFIESKLNLSFWVSWVLFFLIAYTFDETFNRQSQIKKLLKMFEKE